MATTPIISNKNSSNTSSICMLPFVAHGHITPFLELAKILTKKNIFIYFCNTPINITHIKNNLSGDTSNFNRENIQLVELHLPSLPNLPPHFHTAKGLPTHLFPTLLKAVEESKPNFSKILKELSPDLLIFDIEIRWAPTIASTLNIPAVMFSTASAVSLSFNHHMFSFRRIDNYPFPAIFLRELEAMEIIKMAHKTPKEEHPKEEETSERLMPHSTSFILVKSLRDLDGKYGDYYSEMTKKKVVPVGPLIRDTIHDDESSDIIEWLDQKDRCSTVFATFGSECVLSKEQIIEIAHGLEQISGVNFIWFVRFPTGEKVTVEDILPKNFLETVRERGRIVQGWAPQLRILGHPSVGAFMSHCGWSSIMESINCGVPIIAMPIYFNDQPYNARFVQEIGVGFEVLKGNNGIFGREEVGKVVGEVMLGKRAKDMRNNARELMEKMKLNEKSELDAAVKEIVQLAQKN